MVAAVVITRTLISIFSLVTVHCTSHRCHCGVLTSFARGLTKLLFLSFIAFDLLQVTLTLCKYAPSAEKASRNFYYRKLRVCCSGAKGDWTTDWACKQQPITYWIGEYKKVNETGGCLGRQHWDIVYRQPAAAVTCSSRSECWSRRIHVLMVHHCHWLSSRQATHRMF